MSRPSTVLGAPRRNQHPVEHMETVLKAVTRRFAQRGVSVGRPKIGRVWLDCS